MTETESPGPRMSARVQQPILLQLPIGSMYAIYGNIYHQYTPNVSIYYIPYMDPMGYNINHSTHKETSNKHHKDTELITSKHRDLVFFCYRLAK